MNGPDRLFAYVRKPAKTMIAARHQRPPRREVGTGLAVEVFLLEDRFRFVSLPLRWSGTLAAVDYRLAFVSSCTIRPSTIVMTDLNRLIPSSGTFAGSK
jgi:hypothetical protein